MKRSILSALFIVGLSFSTTWVSAQFAVSVTIRTAPPAMPVYTQPPCPVEGWLWTPGYWAYDDYDGYYWVPGVWLAPPRPGFLWTPGYWGYVGGAYGWHAGYWGPHIGFYGGVNYGYGYGGVGFVGGEWHGGVFRYNTAVVNVNTTVVHNTYVNNTVVVNNNTTVNRVSYNGGAGTSSRPTPQEQTAMNENHVAPTQEQVSHNQTASRDKNAFVSTNGGRPATTAMSRVGGERFGSEGHSAPAPMARPAGHTNNQAAVAHNAPAREQRSRQQQQQPRAQQQRPHPQPHGRPHAERQRGEGEGHRRE